MSLDNLPEAFRREVLPQSLAEAFALYKEALGVPDHLAGRPLQMLHAAFVKGLEVGVVLGLHATLPELQLWRAQLDAFWDDLTVAP